MKKHTHTTHNILYLYRYGWENGAQGFSRRVQYTRAQTYSFKCHIARNSVHAQYDRVDDTAYDDDDDALPRAVCTIFSYNGIMLLHRANSRRQRRYTRTSF